MDLERTIEFLLEQQATAQAQSHARMAQIDENLKQTTEIGRQTRLELRRAVRLSVQEARAERKRRREADGKLAASQEELRRSLQAYLDSLHLRRNGHDKN